MPSRPPLAFQDHIERRANQTPVYSLVAAIFCVARELFREHTLCDDLIQFILACATPVQPGVHQPSSTAIVPLLRLSNPTRCQVRILAIGRSVRFLVTNSVATWPGLCSGIVLGPS